MSDVSERNPHLFYARIVGVYDADTVTAIIELDEFDIRIKTKLRLYGINTPEIRTKDKKEKVLGLEAKEYLQNLILNKEVLVDIIKRGKFGRHLSLIYYKKVCINDLLVEKGLAKVYFGGKRTGWFGDESV